jgi:hypothetical protein
MKKITAKFNSTCAETGRKLSKGSDIYYNTTTRKAYHPESDTVKNYLNGGTDDGTAGYIQAQEDAYFDNWSSANL